LNFLQKLVGRAVRALYPLTNPSLWRELFGITQSAAGPYVTPASALKNTAVMCAHRVLAESVGYLPLITYERIPGGGKKRATDLPLYSLLHDEPNRYMSSVTFRETLQGHLCGWGNAYAEIQWGAHGQPIALWPLLPNFVNPEVREGTLRYWVTLPDGQFTSMSPDDLIHIPGLGFDGLRGYSPITMAREALGLAFAGEELAGRFYRNGPNVSGVLEHPGTLSEDAAKRLRESIERRHSGLSNAYRVMILEDGLKFTQSMPLKDAQFLEGRKFQISEIARMYRIPPHMLADLDRASWGNIEHMSLEFVIFSLGPWLRKWEQELNRKLFSAQARKRYFIEFNVDGFLRGDLKSRYDAYAVARLNGWMNANDILELENRNPIPGGDVYWQPMNVGVLGAPAPVPEPKAAPAVNNGSSDQPPLKE